MPPKKAGGGSKKAEQKKVDKIVQDKTFGLKNKNKSKSVQKYIQGVQSQVKGPQSKKAAEAQQNAKKKQQEEAERKRLEDELFKPAVVQAKVPLGVDPKSVVCEFYKKGLCTKGDKCKYSHNLEQHRKSEKIDLYTDRRDLGDEDREKLEADTMDTWDQNKLEDVVQKKQGEENKQNKTKIVCKYFLEAIESRKYGWFWDCPNGGDKCIYQHSLPPGFELKSTKKVDEEDEDAPTIEEKIEEERTKLTKRTPLTLELFLKWKEEKKKEREAEEKELRAKRDADIKSGRAMRSGREMFVYNPDLFVDDEDVLDTSELPEEKEEGPVIRIEVSETSISLQREEENGKQEEGEDDKEEEQDGEGEGNGNEEDGENGVEIQEDLFVEDDIPDDVE